MYAKVENNTVVKANSSLASFNKAAVSWSKAQLEAKGITDAEGYVKEVGFGGEGARHRYRCSSGRVL